jgi:hypothetical protein
MQINTDSRTGETKQLPDTVEDGRADGGHGEYMPFVYGPTTSGYLTREVIKGGYHDNQISSTHVDAAPYKTLSC